MFGIPQEELDKLAGTDGLFDEHTEVEEEAESVVIEKVAEKVSVSPDEDTAEQEKARIPYSRFEKVNEAKIRAEERLAILEELHKNSDVSPKDKTEDEPDERWLRMYGDNDDSREAWKLDQQMKEELLEKATTKAIERIQSQAKETETELKANLDYIEENLSKFQETLGRELTEAEESAILDIQDEFTPKDENGKYLAPLLSPEKAFEVFNLRNSNAKTEKILAKRKVVALTGSSESEGEVTNTAFDNYRPGVSGLWRSAL